MDHMRYPAWQKPLREAIQETNQHKLLRLVGEAEAAIFQRLQELARTHDGDEESRAIHKACQDLLEIKTERLGWPGVVDERREVQADAEPERSRPSIPVST